jgi:alcohol dehydrogenase YqhD (iron-dependent ADH family)
LAAQRLDYVELAGVDPNPRLASVKQGAALCRQHGVDFVLAVGGGSSIDCAKGIAAAALDDGDPWDFWAWKRPITRALPLGTVLTLAATGSEMNDGCVITNEDTREKHGASGPALFPRFSILDPTHTYSVSRRQTASGTADIMTHVYEFYFSHAESAYLQNGMAEAVLKTCVKYGPIACEYPDDYEARANLMWAGSMALNGVVSDGLIFDGFNHPTEHAVSAIYDLTHGVGLAILATHWMEYILGPETVLKFVAFARNVWGVSGDDAMAVAREGILRTRAFFTKAWAADVVFGGGNRRQPF